MRVGLAMGLCAAFIAATPALSQTEGVAPINTLHQALHLAPEQEAAWKVYRAQAAAPSLAQGRRQAAAQMFPNLSAPQRMDLIEAEMKQELADLQRQSQALKAFYGTLTPEQKSTFDAQTLPPQNSQAQMGQ
jgi:uncharacterized tellurite resistance protein B-like protein